MKKVLLCSSVLLIVLSIIATFSFAGCKAATSEETTAGVTEEAEEAAEESPIEVKTLTFMRTGTPETLRPILEPIIAQFEAENPDIKVDLIDFGWADAEKKLPVMASTKTLPDIMYHLPGHIFEMADAGLIVDLNKYLDDELKNDIFPSILEAGQYKGHQYLIPCGALTLVLWYNTELFEQAGLDPEAPPANWEETLAFAKEIKEDTGIPGIGIYAKSAGETSMVFESLYASAVGGPTWDAEKQEYTYFDDPGNKDAALSTLKFMNDLVPFSQGNVVEMSRFDGRTAFRDELFAMEMDVITMKTQIEDQFKSGKLKVALLPQGPSGKYGTALDVGGLFIPTNSKYPDEAWKFLRYLMNTENQIEHTKYGSVPILKSEAETYVGDSFWDIIAQSVESSVPQGMVSGQQAVWNARFEQLQLMYLGDQTPEETIDNMIIKEKEALSSLK